MKQKNDALTIGQTSEPWISNFFLFNDWFYSKNIDLKDFKLTLPKGIDIYVEALGVN